MKPIPVIYILSTGRSGSTILDLLLGMHPAIWTLGEAQMLPSEVRENLKPCGCGKPVNECYFWRLILDSINFGEGNYPIEFFRKSRKDGKAVRWRYLKDILCRKTSYKLSKAAQEYGQNNAVFFEIVKNTAEESIGYQLCWLVDASKDIYRLFWLQQSPLFNIRVIQLIKDPRAFVYSMTRNDPDNWSRVIRFSGRWFFQNMLFTYICRDPDLKNNFIKIRYEDLASSPELTMKRLGDWLGIEFSGLDLTQFRKHETHAIAGNPTRWKNSTIKLDESWKNNMPVRSARIAWIFNLPLARLYGYRR